MRFNVLGELQIVGDDGVATTMASNRQRAILGLLLAADGYPVSTDRLVDAVWGDDLPANPKNALQQTVTHLRKLLEPERTRAGVPTVLLSSEAGYRLNLSEVELDVAEFDSLMTRASELRNANDVGEALQTAEAAVAMWRGSTAYADVADVIALEGEQRRLTERRIEALELEVDCRLALDGPEAVIPQLEVLTSEHPHREGLWSQLMTALYGAGRQADALQAFQRASSAAGELGLVVSPALRELEQQILLQDAALVAPAASGVASNVPAAKGRLIGREAELIDVMERLRRSRLVTVTGPGGSGKTELGLEIARQWEANPSIDGGAVWFVGLEDLRDATLLEPSIAAVVGMVESGTRSVRDALADHFGDRPVLLVMDNCEHLVKSVANLVSYLLDGCQNLTVLATSQTPLAVVGESRVPLSPLATPGDLDGIFASLADSPAVQLFIERSEQADAGFVPTDADLRAIVNIVTFLDGMPLAIELAAARTRSLTPIEIARLLHDGLGLLSKGPNDAPERQQTLTATIEWSFDLLDDEERETFIVLSSFSGGFDTESAAALMESSEIVANDMIDQLVASSIVTRDVPVAGRSRFRLLETLRQFAYAKLGAEPDQATIIHRRHARFFADRAARLDRELIAAGQAEAFALLVEDEDNYRSAMAWSLDHNRSDNDDLDCGISIAGRLGRFWDWRGDLAEASTWLDRFRVAAGENEATVDRCLVWSWDAFFASELGQHQRSNHSNTVAAALASESGDYYASIVVASGQGLRNRVAGRPEEALVNAGRLAELGAQVGGDWWVALSNNLRALAYLDIDDLDAASDAATVSHTQFTAVGDQRAVGWALTAQAQIELAFRRLDRAAELAKSAAATSIEAGDGRSAGWALQIGAVAAKAAGDDTRAAELEAEAQALLNARGMAASPWAKASSLTPPATS